MISFKNGLLASLTRFYDTLSKPRLLVTTLEQEEIATVEGDRFYAEYDVTLTSNETQYILFHLPISATVNVGFQNRTFKSLNGSAQMEILWDSTNSGLGASILPFNENNNFRGIKDAQLLVNLIPNANIISEGIMRETDFLTGTGQGSNSSGDVSPELGFRIYKAGTDFLFKVTNLENSDNRVIIAYSWIEAPSSL